ncbi:hypothetical protein [Paenibacillus sp. NPDC058177]|uniref:hypothetical protein n=1 Tax=Paenibacillus sp. NPDC058177 TaxID=3346369 RepID=UPI0036D7ACC9
MAAGQLNHPTVRQYADPEELLQQFLCRLINRHYGDPHSLSSPATQQMAAQTPALPSAGSGRTPAAVDVQIDQPDTWLSGLLEFRCTSAVGLLS